jgi:hypothetical protein
MRNRQDESGRYKKCMYDILNSINDLDGSMILFYKVIHEDEVSKYNLKMRE